MSLERPPRPYAIGPPIQTQSLLTPVAPSFLVPQPYQPPCYSSQTIKHVTDTSLHTAAPSLGALFSQTPRRPSHHMSAFCPGKPFLRYFLCITYINLFSRASPLEYNLHEDRDFILILSFPIPHLQHLEQHPIYTARCLIYICYGNK